MVAVYVIVSLLIFFAQWRNGLFQALGGAIFWPILIPGMAIMLICMMIYQAIKQR